MIFQFRQGKGITQVWMGELQGVTAIMRGDKYDSNLGLVIALIKIAPTIDKRDTWTAAKLEGYAWKKAEVSDVALLGLLKIIILRDYIILKRQPKNFGAVFLYLAKRWIKEGNYVSLQTQEPAR